MPLLSAPGEANQAPLPYAGSSDDRGATFDSNENAKRGSARESFAAYTDGVGATSKQVTSTASARSAQRVSRVA
jgi:hypothetical protein